MPDGWTWFDLNWPWLGLVAAVVLLALLATDRLRLDPTVSRWRDPSWLGWLAVPLYVVHEAEEYGVDATGTRHAFPDALCDQVGLAAYPQCSIPEPFFVFVNIPAFWVVAPLAALLGRRLPLVGLSYWGVIAVNGLVHLLPVVRGDGYAPGVLTSVLLFLPLAAWTAYAAFLRGPLPRIGLVPVLAGGVLVHVVLMSSLLLHRDDHLGDALLLALQVANAFLPVAVCALASRVVDVRAERASTGSTAVG